MPNSIDEELARKYVDYLEKSLEELKKQNQLAVKSLVETRDFVEKLRTEINNAYN